MAIYAKLKRWYAIWNKQRRLEAIENIRTTETGKVLLIKLDAIGDFIIWLDSAKEYKKIYAGKHIVLLCNKMCSELAESTGYFDEIKVLDISKAEVDDNYFENELTYLKKEFYEILIQTAYSRTLHMDLLAAAIPAAMKIAFLCDETRSNLSRRLVSNTQKKKLDSIYDQLINTSAQNIMEILRNGEMISQLGNDRYKTDIPYLKENISKSDKVPSGDYFVVFPGASTQRKMWDINHFLAVSDYIIEHKKWNAYVCGSATEKYLGEYLVKNTVHKEKVFNYCGETDLVELAEVIRNAKFVISNDTSGIHYAAAVNTIGLCVFGEYNYGRFLPYQSDKRESSVKVCSLNMPCRNCASGKMTLKCKMNILKNGRYLCIEAISEERVIKLINSILNIAK